MAYLAYDFCAMTALWLAYLLFRSWKLHVPGQLGVCRNVAVGEMVGCCLFEAALLGIVIWTTTQDEPGVWMLQLALLVLIAGFAAALSVHVHSSMAFNTEGFAICGLFGAPKWYAWADVTACKGMTTVVPRSNKLCYMYSLKLPDRDVALYDYTPGACAFINELRRHKPLLAIPVPGRTHK